METEFVIARIRCRLEAALNCTLVVLLWLAIGTTPALANGSANEIFRGEQGPYEIVVAIMPPTPVVGSVHITVMVLEANRKRPITGATVTIAAHGPEVSTAGPVVALSKLTEPRYYDANILVETIGVWQFEVAVESQFGEERVVVPIRVTEATVNWGAVISMLVAILLVVPLVASGYRGLRSRSNPPRR